MATNPSRKKAREAAEIEQSRWDTGSYVRWVVQTAYGAFERACCDALDDPDLGRNLPKLLSDALKDFGLQADLWEKDPWRGADEIRRIRNKYAHQPCAHGDLFPDLATAERAIANLRVAILEVYRVAGKDAPLWAECDSVPIQLGGSSAWASIVSAGADADPQAVEVVAIHGDQEWTVARIRSTEDPWSRIEQLATGINVPISGVRIYQGGRLREELLFQVRGAKVERPS